MSDFERVMSLWQIEHETAADGYRCIAGVDEAGRGPLAGPVCVAAVVLPVDFYLEGIDDSKKLTEKKKNRLYDEIIANAVSYSVVMIESDDIDRLNILVATHKGMRDAVDGLKPKPDFALIDGNSITGMELAHRCVVKGDSKSISIAAASVLAKVTRDRYMTMLDEKYPMYGFKIHKGYPTKAHYEALQKYGACGAHRKSFNLKLGIGG